MKILIDIGHPAHVYLFKNLCIELIKKGHIVFFTTREKEITLSLLNSFNFNYKSFGKNYKGIFGKL